MKTTALLKLDSAVQLELLIRDIPHRICASLTWLKTMSGDWAMPPDPEWKDKDRDKFHIYCVGRSIDEGRKIAMRWLIEFVGVSKNKNNLPDRPYRKASDVWIEHINCGKLFDLQDPNAEILADVWQGCTQASAHSTRDTSHPLVGETELAEALQIVIDHLEKHLYIPNGFILREIVCDQEDRKQFKLPAP